MRRTSLHGLTSTIPPKTASHTAIHQPASLSQSVEADSDEGPLTLTLTRIRTLGRGRGARVDLVRDLPTDRLIAEKVFGFGRGLSSLITGALYRLCYQGPFPYRATANAVWAAYYRRKAIRVLAEYWCGVPCVADALYVRWDAESHAFILGTEYIAGHGPRTPPADPHMLRHWLAGTGQWSKSPDDMASLVTFMDQLRAHLRDSGFTGTQWQVDWRTLVATANFLHDGHTWTVVDLESGVPAITMPRYLACGLGMGRFPLFDDTDFATLWSYVERHEASLEQRLGAVKRRYLYHLIKELEVHEQQWKSGEVALFREPRRWVRREARAHIRQQVLERWQQEGRITPQASRVLQTSTLRFLGHWAFGSIGRWAQHGARFVWDRDYRAAVVAPRVKGWVDSGRLRAETGVRLLRNPRFLPLAMLVLSEGFPAQLVRFLHDPQYRPVALRGAYRVLVDERYQLALAEEFITRRIGEWEAAARLTAVESAMLRQAVTTPSAQEYVRGFGVHLALKALLPSVLLDPLFVGVAVTTGSLYPLALMFIRAMAVTTYTTVRWLKRPDLQLGTAFALGMLPKLGILAYPCQLLTVHPGLASFLVRDLASRLGERLPIYGGRHTLMEHYCIRCADVFLALGYSVTQLVGAFLKAGGRVRTTASSLWRRRFPASSRRAAVAQRRTNSGDCDQSGAHGRSWHQVHR